MSRGLNYNQARELLINGFLLDVVEKITDSEIKNLIKNMLTYKYTDRISARDALKDKWFQNAPET